MKTDKLLHLLAGAVITFIIGLWWPVIGLVVGVIAGAAKELIYDKALDRGVPDGQDFIYTVAGSLAAFICVFIHSKLS